MRLIKGLMFEDGSQKYFDALYFGDFHNDLAIIDLRNKIGYISRKGDFVIPPKHFFGTDFSEERAFILDKSTKLIDTFGNILKDFEKEYVPGLFNEQYAQIGEMSYDGESIRIAYINKEGKQITPFSEFRRILNPNRIIDENDDYSCGLLRYQDDEKYGYLTISQEIVIPAEYDFAERFSEDLAVVYNNEKAGFINLRGDIMIPFEFNYATGFSEGIAVVSVDEFMGCINKDLDIVIPFEFDYLGKCNNEMIVFCINEKWGIMDVNSNIIVPEKFDFIRQFVDGICTVVLNNHQGVLDRNGNMLFSDFIIGSEYNLLN